MRSSYNFLMHRILLLISLMISLAAQAKPYDFRIGTYRFFAMKPVSGIYRNGNDLTVFLVSNKTEDTTSSGVISTSICATRLDFTDLFDQIETAKVFDLTSVTEEGKVTISFDVTPNCASSFAGISSDQSIVNNGRVTILSRADGYIKLAYNGTITNYDMFDEYNFSTARTPSSGTLELSGRFGGTINKPPKLNDASAFGN